MPGRLAHKKGPTTHDRLIPLLGASNFRDLGGYKNIEGRETRWRRLFRSDALYALTSADLATMQSLDIRTVIDLRSLDEIAYTGRGLLDQSSIHVLEIGAMHPVEVPVAPSVLDATQLSETYWRYLTTGTVNFVGAFRALSHVEFHPTVMSCFFGKDRTGVLTALVLACLDVGSELIIEDYALSAQSMMGLCERLRSDPIYDETLNRTPSWRLAANPDTMVAFLQQLNVQFGGARSWALHAGITSSELGTLHANLLV